MIKDVLRNADLYYKISDRLKKGLEWLKSTDLAAAENGKYIIDGDNLYANIQEYRTKDSANFEAHRKYIDIQYMIKGEEYVGVCDIEKCKVVDVYNKETDLEFLETSAKYVWQTLCEGEFIILFPTDAHKPSIKIDGSKTVKKVVVKVAID